MIFFFNFTVSVLSALLHCTIFNSLVEKQGKSKLPLGDYIQEVCNRIQARIQDFGSSRCVSIHKTISFHSYRTIYLEGTQ